MSTEPELKKLTVPQLKALCKERNITGYSKLGKEALICKLLGIAPPAPADPNTANESTKPPAKKKKKVVASVPSDSATAPNSAPSSEPSTLTAVVGESSAPSAILPVASASEPEVQKDVPATETSSATLTLPTTDIPSTSSAPTPGSSSAANKETAAKPKKRKNPPSSEPAAIPQDASSEASVAVAPKKKKKKVADTETDGNGTTPAPKKKKKAVVDDNNSASVPEASTQVASNSSSSTTSTSATKRPLSAVTPASVDADAQPSKKQKLATSAPKPRPATTDHTDRPLADAGTISSTTSSAPAVTERPPNIAAPIAMAPPPAKKQKVAVSKLPTTSKFVLPVKAPAPMASPVAPPIVPPKEKSAQPPAILPKVSQKRFKPLMVVGKASAPSQATPVPVVPATSQPLYHLEFPPAPTPASLSTLTLPPPISQRKRAVPRFALLLSQVPDADLGNCLLVSRMFRYAVYLSASHRLNQAFAGKRLSAVLAGLDAKQISMINMWPYLKQRQHERSTRKAQYHASFLSRVFPSSTISEHLWGSPDHERQIVIVLRFLLTRLFFQISVGGSKEGKSWIEGQVVDAQQLVQDEIWAITVRHTTGALESFYVLEATCEPLATLTDPQQAALPVRTDWSAYIAHRSRGVQESTPLRRLLDHLSWTNHEEYLSGISRLWLKRIEAEGEIGTAKRIVAERYILACVVGNSVSGRWMSATAMAQEFAGLDAGVPGHTGTTNPKVNLFLPKHHHVEGVYFTASNKAPLHSALAVLQTPDREYYILRDNGMQVGCEEDGGVAEVWMGMIGCSKFGVALY
ncbi:hypothetical protein FB45DRAFT_896715 [Roridomyces roridus]|uniref:Rho termination factor-like N-terminal domain-containing protein n=1 Tax=Roridomyces roridus TaxID=1738132 RepID=A0AAD7FYA1_9AGAR|nr:hypothetical protein FB45DRAFT_896715 [Roridomyces roridus]